MCGVFGSNDKERFLTLYNLNRKRGTFSTSLVIYTTTGDMVVHRWSGTIGIKEARKELEKSLDNKSTPYFYLGHTQAPTSSKRKFSRETSHPFNSNNWLVAHNGVLTNFDDIKTEFAPKWTNPVDSSIIPYVLDKVYEAGDGQLSPLECIVNGLSLLQGTFGVWIANASNRGLYLARCGSTLFANLIDNDFSSVEFDSSEPLDEGVVYEVTQEGLTSVANFDFNSPFFT
jgi:glucosamine--fructose-6-phosphate aminotransferase (isomerizing)